MCAWLPASDGGVSASLPDSAQAQSRPAWTSQLLQAEEGQGCKKVAAPASCDGERFERTSLVREPAGKRTRGSGAALDGSALEAARGCGGDSEGDRAKGPVRLLQAARTEDVTSEGECAQADGHSD